MCLAQGPQHSDAGEAQPAVPQSRVKHSTTELLRSQRYLVKIMLWMIWLDGVLVILGIKKLSKKWKNAQITWQL